MISFTCDYSEGAHPRILERLAQTNLEQLPGYGMDQYSISAKEKIRAACQAPEADVFFHPVDLLAVLDERHHGLVQVRIGLPVPKVRVADGDVAGHDIIDDMVIILFMRPGYMMRDYIFRRQHERYLAPFTALLVFYSVFTLIVAIVNPQASKSSFADGLIQGLNDSFDASLNLTVHPDSTSVNGHEINLSDAIKSVAESVALTQLDRHPELADTPWKESLAAVEGELRSKGIPLFLGQFLILWAAIAYLLRKYKMSVSGAAAASAYVLCQYCIFMFLALILSLNTDSSLWILLLGLLLFIDYRQMLGITNRQALILTVKTGLFYLGIKILFYILLTVFLIIFTITKL